MSKNNIKNNKNTNKNIKKNAKNNSAKNISKTRTTKEDILSMMDLTTISYRNEHIAPRIV